MRPGISSPLAANAPTCQQGFGLPVSRVRAPFGRRDDRSAHPWDMPASTNCHISPRRWLGRNAEDAFVGVPTSTRLRQSRLRTGAIDWALYRDGENPRLFIEQFTVASWEEHLRQHRERQTGSDLQDHDDAAALSDPPPRTDHYLTTDVRE
jgi:Transmembrane secretion effector